MEHVSHHHNPWHVIASVFKIDRLFLLLRYAVGFCPSLSLGTQNSAWYAASALQGHVSGEVKEPLEGCELPWPLTERSSPAVSLLPFICPIRHTSDTL